MKFRPEEVLFSPTAACNLACGHCHVKKSARRLSLKAAVRFLEECRALGVRRVGFTGGEPFLAPGHLIALSRAAAGKGMSFGRIMTNGVWFRKNSALKGVLQKLHSSGYDGDICVSVDAFHAQPIKKLAMFIRTAVEIWNRPDQVSVAYVAGAAEAATKEKLVRLSKALGGRLVGLGTRHCRIKGGGFFMKAIRINLAPVGKASRLKDPWDGKWFREDFCRGPGNVFYVLPDGRVKPCCGYATERDGLTIGNIMRDPARDILKNAHANRFVRAVFGSGLSAVRRRLERSGVVFPGKTSSHCYFCDYLFKEIPNEVLQGS